MAQDWDPKGNYNPYAAPVAMIAPPPRVEDADLRLLGARSTRFVARLIDNVLFVLSAMPGFFGVMIGHGKLELPAYAGVLVAWAFIAYQCYLVTTTGQSVAKRWMGLKVVRSDGSRAGFVHGVDQGVHNYIVHNAWLRDVCRSTNGEVVLTLHYHLAQNRAIFVIPDGRICDDDARIIPIVHQYNRSPDLMEQYRQLYAS